MFRRRNLLSLIFLVVLFVTPRVQGEIDFHSFLKEFQETDWIPYNQKAWLKKFVWNGEALLVNVEIDEDDDVNFFIRAQCLATNQVDLIFWISGNRMGMRDDCSDRKQLMYIPKEFEEKIGTLPEPIRRMKAL